MKSLVKYIMESKLNPKDVISAIMGAYDQWRRDTENEPGEWSTIEDMYTAKEPSDEVIDDIYMDLGVDKKTLKDFFNTPQGKTTWKKVQNKL